LGAVAAVFSKSNIDATCLVTKMLRAMRHRAQDGAAVAWGENFESARSPADLRASSPAKHVAIGYAFTGILPDDIQQPVPAGEGWFCLDGRIVAGQRLVGVKEATRLLDQKLNSAEFPSIQSHIDGAYSACLCVDDTLLVTRDPLGLKSTFMGRRNDLVGVASDRKALWAIGIPEPTSLPPGATLTATPDGVTVNLPEPAPDELKASYGSGVGAEELSQSLAESVSIQTAGIDRVCAGFSGGVDSTVLAKIAKDAGVDVLLVTVGLGRTAEMTQAESVAREIGLPIVTKEFSQGDVERYLDRMLWLEEEPSLMKVSIAMALHWAGEVCVENGRRVLMLGQGSDELFGGYKRFATILGERGERAALEAISESVRTASEVNYQRDDQAVSSLRAELRLPFATMTMRRIASTVPLGMKVRSPSDGIRKWILRDAAIRIGLSPAVAMRPKRAIQHTSGIEKAIRELAKKQGLPAQAFLENRLREIRNRFSTANGKGEPTVIS